MRVRLITANLDFVTPVNKDRRNLTHLLRKLVARPLQAGTPQSLTGVVMGFQEARNFRLAGLARGIAKVLSKLRIPVPSVVQGHGLAKSGTGIVSYGVKLHHTRLILAAVSRFTMPRWITRAGADVDGGRLEVIVVHILPPRAGKRAQLKQLDKVKKLTDRAIRRGHGWAVLADFNMMLNEVAKILGGKGYGTPRGIGIVVSHNVIVSDHGEDVYGLEHHDTDHPAEWVDVAGLKAS